MKIIILGLPYEVVECSIREIVFFLLFFSIICVILGRFVNKTNIKNNYFSLIRNSGYSRLWHNWCAKIIALSGIMIGMFYAVILCSNAIHEGELLKKTTILALVLWFLGFVVIGEFFIVFQNVRHGEASSFLIVMLIEVLSTFFSDKFPIISKIFIGNYVMLRRSSIFTSEGYSIVIVIMTIGAIIVGCTLWGYRIFFRRR